MRSAGKRPKSRSAVQSSVTPWVMQIAAITSAAWLAASGTRKMRGGSSPRRETHARTPTATPTPSSLPRDRGCVREPCRGADIPCARRRRECSYRPRSRSAAPVDLVPDLMPVAIGKLGLKTSAKRFDGAEAKRLSPGPPLLEHPAEPLLHELFQRRLVAGRNLASLAKDRLGNIDGCLHVASNTLRAPKGNQSHRQP